ncbi:hypothetical protein KP79_PYT20995 [Mizuhopecten yessoensis]|uniref:Uncharacterized protein n=1 Tax=Mizuhopecten yessoensis TaxID=6573 RepID=A0A210QYH6_MIZYE|nr:hypothetical protein KP79_PYT20995 [Mizuhopecten yessoensis]
MLIILRAAGYLEDVPNIHNNREASLAGGRSRSHVLPTDGECGQLDDMFQEMGIATTSSIVRCSTNAGKIVVGHVMYFFSNVDNSGQRNNIASVYGLDLPGRTSHHNAFKCFTPGACLGGQCFVNSQPAKPTNIMPPFTGCPFPIYSCKFL